MKKIVYLLPSLGNSGGIERVLSTKVNWLVNNTDFTIIIITQRSNPKDLFFNFDNKVEIESLNLENPKRNLTDPFLRNYKEEYKNALKAKLFSIRPDITISLFGNEYDFLYKIKDGSKKIIEFHFSRNYLYHLISNMPNLSFRPLRLLNVQMTQFKQRRAANNYDALILLTEKDKQLWNEKKKFSNIKIIPNPVSFTSEQVSSLENKNIIAIGRYITQKGFDLLIQSYSLIADQIPGWKLNIIGTGQDEDYLNRLIVENEMQGRIFLQKPSKNVKNILLNSSLFVFPSRYEGFGLVMTEAMECGLPVIAYDCECGPSEIIKHEKDGYLIEPFNIEDFAQSILKLTQNLELRKEMGKLARKNVKRFHEDIIMDQWLTLFNTLTEKSKKDIL